MNFIKVFLICATMALLLIDHTVARIPHHPSTVFTNELAQNSGKSGAKMVNNRFSILEALSLENENLIRKQPYNLDSANDPTGKDRVMCMDGSYNRDDVGEMKMRIKNSIESILNFYASHMDVLNMTDYAIGLNVLKAVTQRRGESFQLDFPLDKWTTQICNQTNKLLVKIDCDDVSRVLNSRDQHWDKWSSADVLTTEQFTTNVGRERETLSPSVHHNCLDSLLARCEVPQTCQNSMFDPAPKSQYMLTHQLIHRIFAQSNKESCGLSGSLVDAAVNRKLCTKMLQEAELISNYGGPFIYRDLFVEQVSFCGFIRYPNFFRDDWLNMILSWQSKSDYGCFIKEQGSNFVSNDHDIPRRVTDKERKMGLEFSGETCQPHLTSFALSALTLAWDYLEENCVTAH